MEKLKRVYHPYWLWEDYQKGFYNNCSGSVKQSKINSCINMFNSYELTKEFMYKVVNEWKYSCEHNLTNESVNKIAYIGQGACCLYDGIPNTVTMECWSKLSKEVQERSNILAEEVINYWYEQNKYIQLCLNLD